MSKARHLLTIQLYAIQTNLIADNIGSLLHEFPGSWIPLLVKLSNVAINVKSHSCLVFFKSFCTVMYFTVVIKTCSCSCIPECKLQIRCLINFMMLPVSCSIWSIHGRLSKFYHQYYKKIEYTYVVDWGGVRTPLQSLTSQ